MGVAFRLRNSLEVRLRTLGILRPDCVLPISPLVVVARCCYILCLDWQMEAGGEFRPVCSIQGNGVYRPQLSAT